MTTEDLLKYREELIEEVSDQEEGFSENNLFRKVIPLLFENRLLDSEDFEETYFINLDPKSNVKSKINGYKINDSEERLQLFIINDLTTSFSVHKDEFVYSIKKAYENVFTQALNFVNNAIKGYYFQSEIIQDSDPITILNNKLFDDPFQFDVIEIFQISLSASIESRGASLNPKEFSFADKALEIKNTSNKNAQKTIKLINRLVDLNFLYTLSNEAGKGLEVDVEFSDYFGGNVEALLAAKTANFESYLCVLSADGLANLYQKENARLLEKNVRSFLQFGGSNSVNSGMKKTIKTSPEKFIAFNNGLTITATKSVILELEGKTFIKSLGDFQIVNGGQTTASLYFSKKDGISLNEVNVMAKINIVKEASDLELNKLVSDISLYSNSQNKVSKVDLNSKNEQISRIKTLSLSIMSPSGKKWFFENKKGEFKTAMLMAGKSQRANFERNNPKERFLTKENLGKYYMSWGEKPYLVKLGGDKLFRYFLEDLNGEYTKGVKREIDREFYEELISKVILFKGMELIHGAGNNKIGSLRAAVIPYSISLLYKYSIDKKLQMKFNLSKIWINEKIEDDFRLFLYDLMTLVDKLIPLKSATADYNTCAKKVELWDSINECIEVKSFMDLEKNKDLIRKYQVVASTIANKSNSKNGVIDFEELSRNARIHDFGRDFFAKLSLKLNYSEGDIRKIDSIVNLISKREILPLELLEFIELKIALFSSNTNKDLVIEELLTIGESYLEKSLDYIIEVYSKCIYNKGNIRNDFLKIQEESDKMNFVTKNAFKNIGSTLNEGNPPSIKDLYNATEYLKNRRNLVKIVK